MAGLAVSSSPAPHPQARQRNSLSAGGAPLPPGDDLPIIIKSGITSGKKSMSGITVNERCLNVFTHIKTNSRYKWIVFKIDDQGSEVVIEEVGPSNSSFSDFTSVLPESQCRYGVFDYAYTPGINKLVFINWAPDSANTRTKMMYASTKDFFKAFLDGVGAEVQACDVSELTEAEVQERVHQAVTRK